MNDLRKVLPCVLASLIVVAIPLSSTAAKGERNEEKHELDPAAIRILGSAVPEQRAIALGWMLRVGDGSLFAALKDTGPAGQPKFEGSGLTVDVRLKEYDPLRLENAHVVLAPSADGRTCRFEIAGAPFGVGSSVEATGTIEWAVGPYGGDKLDIEYRLGNAPVESVRTAFPERMDPAFSGMLNASGKASGIVGETSSDEAPATPLRGNLVASLDLQVLGRVAPLQITSDLQLDDRKLRFVNGHLRWQDMDLGLRGWVAPDRIGEIDLAATFTNVDAHKVATEWNVPEPLRPVASLSGVITLKGLPQQSLMRYEATAPTLEVQGFGGFPVRMTKVKITGSLLAVNAEISDSMKGDETFIGDIGIGNLPFGMTWFRGEYMLNASNSKLWGGDNDFTLSYKPENHPAFLISGRLIGSQAPTLVEKLAPWLGLDVEGTGSISYAFGQDAARTPRWSAHASIGTGRIGNVDLFARAFDALAAADPALKLTDAATLLPQPRRGTGTRVDKLFFEIERSAPDAWQLGGMILRANEFQLNADGEISKTTGLKLDGTITVPQAVAEKLIAAAPWMKALRLDDGAPMYLPVVVSGTAKAPVVALAPGYAELLASAKRGETVTAPGVKKPRHVGGEGLAIIPQDPAALNL